jgi:ABC-type amino acid transport substrate-binding protein
MDQDDRNGLYGFDRELIETLADQAGFEPEYVQIKDGEQAFQGLSKYEYDILIAEVKNLDSVKDAFAVTAPYCVTGQAVVAKTTSEFGDPVDLAGRIVGVQTGTSGKKWLEEHTEAIAHVYDDAQTCFEALYRDEVEAIVYDKLPAIEYTNRYRHWDLRLLQELATSKHRILVMRKDDESKFLFNAIRLTLEEFMATEEYGALCLRHLKMSDACFVPREARETATPTPVPPLPTATSTTTTLPTATSVPTAVPTATATPRPTDTKAQTPTPTATVTQRPTPTWIHTPLPTSTPVPTPTPTFPPLMRWPEHLEPSPDAVVKRDKPVGLRWNWSAELKPEEYFSVRVWRREGPDDEHCIHVRISERWYEFDRNSEPASSRCPGTDEFCWNVQVVKRSTNPPPDWLKLSQNSSPTCFSIEGVEGRPTRSQNR